MKNKFKRPHKRDKLRIFESFRDQVGAKVFVETGSYMGHTIELVMESFEEIYSIEISTKLYQVAKKRILHCTGEDKMPSNIRLMRGDSSVKMRKILDSFKGPAVIWLDAHYSRGETARGKEETAIIKELQEIFSRDGRILRHAILIDDARCFKGGVYPTLEEVAKMARSSKDNIEVVIEDDMIKIFPTSSS